MTPNPIPPFVVHIHLVVYFPRTSIQRILLRVSAHVACIRRIKIQFLIHLCITCAFVRGSKSFLLMQCVKNTSHLKTISHICVRNGVEAGCVGWWWMRDGAQYLHVVLLIHIYFIRIFPFNHFSLEVFYPRILSPPERQNFLRCSVIVRPHTM